MPDPYVWDEENHIARTPAGLWIPTTTQVQKAMHLSFDFERFVEADLLDRTGTIGSKVHDLTDIYDKYNDIDPTYLDMSTHGYVESYIGWRRLSGFVSVQWSVRMCETINGLQWSGELDKFGKLNGHDAIIDLKTGAKSDSHGIQLNSYEMLKYRSSRVGRVIKAIVHLHEDGSPGTMCEYKEHSPIDGSSYADTFMAALHCLHWSLRRKLYSERDFLEIL